MKLAALAVDYNGTTAINDVFDASVRKAIGDARARGLAVILVTGRRLADLRTVAGDLSCFDVVVAENGAVLEFPRNAQHVLLAHSPQPAFLDELRGRRIDFTQGESVIEADAASATAILEVIRALEQPLVLAFNRGRVMVLPQAVAKSTGLRRALHTLRLSIHNTVGIGDAENDHDLLDACEVGVAVEWGSPALRAVADEVIPGTGPPAVAEYIRRISRQSRLSAAQMGRRRLFLGHQHNGEPVSLTVRGRTILIAGEPGTGKSWLAGLLCEQLILQGYCVCIIDPEGDYRELEALPSVITLGGDDPPPHARDMIRALRYPDVSVIVDLSKISHREKREYLQTLLPLLVTLRHQTGLPHKILLDEAHYFLGEPATRRLIDPELAGYILVTYRVSGIDPSIREASDVVVVVTKESDPLEADTLCRLCQPQLDTSVSAGDFSALAMNEAALLPGVQEAHGQIRRFRLAPRLTSHVRHQMKYLDMPVSERQAFVFTDEGRTVARARTLKAFIGLLASIPPSSTEGHLRRHDFSRWFDEVFRDHALAAHLRDLERRVDDNRVTGIVEGITQAIRARYETAANSQLVESTNAAHA
jgi:hydroxymethylpyrimidine pyrophosphatase-like HAD family hydrolase